MYTPPLYNEKLYFTPRAGGTRKIIMDDGESKDPRLKVSSYSARMTDLTEEDTGNFSAIFGLMINVDELHVSVCTDPVSRLSGQSYFGDIPQEAESLEFSTHLSNTSSKVLWSRSDPQTSQGGRAEVRSDSWKITKLTQEDNGYYIIRRRDRSLLSRMLLTVEGKYSTYSKFAGEKLIIRYPSTLSPWTVRVKLDGARSYIAVVNAGSLLTDSNPYSYSKQFNDRVQLLPDGIQIDRLETRDSGTYAFEDKHNNLGLTVNLEVHPGRTAFPPVSVIVPYFVGAILAAVVCFCCVKKCCIKGQAASQTEVAPYPNHHDKDQSTVPSSSPSPAPAHSYQPINPGVSRETANPSSDPTDYSAVVNIPSSEEQIQTPVTPVGGHEDTPAPTFGIDNLSSDHEPRFELEGLTIPSAPPLSSDLRVCDVDSSEKFNFL
ncbi:uncharacterized protein LOC117818093 [Xyrichtys novacula]|nr:uncharacterized protein LOC117818093 [Xyrichtys novacula]